MTTVETVFGVERDFINVLQALSNGECRFNRRLKDKTKKVAELLSKVAEVRKTLANGPSTSSEKVALS